LFNIDFNSKKYFFVRSNASFKSTLNIYYCLHKGRPKGTASKSLQMTVFLALVETVINYFKRALIINAKVNYVLYFTVEPIDNIIIIPSIFV